MTSDEMNDIVMEKFKAIGSKRFINGIDLSPQSKEPDMTLTDNIRYIQSITQNIIELADMRKYEDAHSALDDIEIKCHKLHRHFDNLQRKTEPFPVPSEVDGS